MSKINKIIQEAAPRAYYVGGVLRDGLLGRCSGDIDLALPRDLVKPAACKLAKLLKASAFEMDADFCVWRVSAKNGLQIDLSALIGKDIKEDLKRRDFTINALACAVAVMPPIKTKIADGKLTVLIKPAAKDILDLNDGVKDIKNKIIRANAKNVFTDDPLRLLRAVRCAAELGFEISKPTCALIKKNAPLITQPAAERVQEELRRVFNRAGTKYYLQKMDNLGLLTTIFPLLAAQKGCAQVYYGKGGVFTHTLDVVDRMELLLKNLKRIFPKYHKKLLPFTQDIALYKMAALLHDIAKPQTAKVMGDRLRFFYHEEEGAKLAEVILKNLKYSAADTRLITKMIAYHLRPSNLASNEIITDRGVYNFFKELGDASVPMLLMCWADYTSYITPAQAMRLVKPSAKPVMTIEAGKKKGALGKTLRHMQVVNFLLGKYFNETKKLVLPRRLIDGRDIISLLKIQPGPKIGIVLEAAVLAQVEGKIKTREQALAWLLQNKKDFGIS